MWVEECRDNLWGTSGREVVWAVIGNKSDLLCEISHERVEDICDTLETDLSFCLSAKTGDNVRHSFKKVVEQLHDKKMRMSQNGQRKSSFTVTRTNNESSKKCCT